MEIWFIIFLSMSLTVNILLVRAYIKLQEETAEIRVLFKEFEKTHIALGNFVTKHKPIFAKKGGKK